METEGKGESAKSAQNLLSRSAFWGSIVGETVVLESVGESVVLMLPPKNAVRKTRLVKS